MRILEAQIVNHEAAMKDAINNVKAQINNDQREANRLFIPEIKLEMQKIYPVCAAEKGTYSRRATRYNLSDMIDRHRVFSAHERQDG